MALGISPGDRIKVTAHIVNGGSAYTYKFGCSIGMDVAPPGPSIWHPYTGGPVQYDDIYGEYRDVPLATAGEAGDSADVDRILKISDTITWAKLAELLDIWCTVKDADLNILNEDLDVNELEPLFPSATITFISVEKI